MNQGVDPCAGARHGWAQALRKHFSPEQIKRTGTHTTNAAFERYLMVGSDDLKDTDRHATGVIDFDNGKGVSMRPLFRLSAQHFRACLGVSDRI